MKTVISASKSGEVGFSESEIDKMAGDWADACIAEMKRRAAARAAAREAEQPKDESEKNE